MTIKSELLELTIQHGGILLPESVVQWAAEHKESALYHSLEWNDAVAAQAHRIAQVRQLIAVHVVNEEGVRQLVSLTIDRQEGGGYRPIDTVMRNSNMREVLLADALADLQRLQSKYGQLKELASVFVAAESVAAKQAKRGAPRERQTKRR